MNYKNDMYDEIQYGIYKSTKEKYSKKVNHKKNLSLRALAIPTYFFLAK